MSNQYENPNNGSKKISWVSIVNAVVLSASAMRVVWMNMVNHAILVRLSRRKALLGCSFGVWLDRKAITRNHQNSTSSSMVKMNFLAPIFSIIWMLRLIQSLYSSRTGSLMSVTPRRPPQPDSSLIFRMSTMYLSPHTVFAFLSTSCLSFNMTLSVSLLHHLSYLPRLFEK